MEEWETTQENKEKEKDTFSGEASQVRAI